LHFDPKIILSFYAAWVVLKIEFFPAKQLTVWYVSAPTVLSLLGKFHPNHPSSPCADILTACEILGLGLELGTGGWICRGPASGKQNRPQGYIKHKEVGRKGGKMGWGDAKSSVLNRFSLFLLFFFFLPAFVCACFYFSFIHRENFKFWKRI